MELLPDVSVALAVAYNFSGEAKKILDLMPDVLDLISETNETVTYQGMSIDLFTHLSGYCALGSFQLGKFNQAEIFLEQGLRKATKIDDLIGICLIEFYYGFHFLMKGEGNQSIKHLQNSLVVADELEHIVLQGLSLTFQGRGFQLIGDIVKALELINKGLNVLSSDASYIGTQAGSNNILSEIYLEMNNIEKAFFHAEKSVELSKENEDNQDKGKSAIAIGRVLGKKDPAELNEAEGYIVSGIKILEERQYKPDYAIGYIKLGELYLDAGRYEDSLQNINKAKALFQEMEMDYWIGRTHAALSQYHQQQSDLPQAREQLHNAIDIMKKMQAYGWVETYEKELGLLVG